nr:immunoglobulin light chain junction region [Macaca mulatta]MOX86060.1 immunoglobulin light chain junction region [Macaca mulatta]MOX86578.1 immunoglobulin light chain junction region [Macaca mulatta]MOX86750.1 immunoglobulin light chain junction region [Macaca mulatta]MOX87891.1 immunoglobulin light chain junction region [Macaca mulatta]
CQHHYDSPPTF